MAGKKRPTMRLAAALLLVSLLFLWLVSAAGAATLEACGFRNGPIDMEQLPGDSEWWQPNDDQMRLYNLYMDIYRSHPADGSWGLNGSSEFGGFPSDAELYERWGFHWGNGLAVTCFTWLCDCCQIMESDIAFNPAYTWTSDRKLAETSPGSYLYYNSVLLHEMGHSWGEQTRNEDYLYAEPTVMHAYNRLVVQDNMNLHAKDAYLLRRNYASQTAVLPVVNLAVHSKFADSGHLQWANTSTDKGSYQEGGAISVKNLTVENTGTVALNNVHVRFYLSSDTAISEGDIPLGGGDWSWAGFPAESWGVYSFSDMTVPAGIPAGQYYVGAIVSYDGTTRDAFESDNATRLWSRITVTGPDLVVQSVSVSPSAPQPGQTVTVSATVRNQGNAAAGPFAVDLYRDRSVAPAPGETGDASCTVAGLAAGASTTCTRSIGSYAAAGSVSIWAQADSDAEVAETSEANNVFGPKSVTVKGIPELVLSQVGNPPARVAPGVGISVSDTVGNLGTGASTVTSYTRYRLSADTIKNSGDILLTGSRAVPALAIGATSSGTATVTVPASTPLGSYYLLACADDTLLVKETDETNNCSASATTVEVTNQLPDLAASAVTVSASAAPGQVINVGDTTKNNGSVPAEGSTTYYYLSSNSSLDASDVYLGSRSVAALAAGASHAGAVSVALPATLATGTWYIVAKADGPGVVSETLENNNTSSKSFKVGPDLTSSTVTAPSVAGPGQLITVGDRTKNSGMAAAPASVTWYYLSANSSWDAGDTLLGNRSVAALAAGEVSTGTTSVTLPAALATGTWYIIAKVDGPGAIVETSESNNTASKSFKVGPDLTSSSVTAPASAVGGQTISVGNSTKNSGGAPAPESVTYYYLSTNSTRDAADTLLGTRAILELAPAGGVSTGSVSVTLPGGLTAGTWYIIASADGPGSVTETSETNNNASRSIRITQ